MAKLRNDLEYVVHAYSAAVEAYTGSQGPRSTRVKFPRPKDRSHGAMADEIIDTMLNTMRTSKR